MSIQKLVHFFYQKNLIKHSKIRKLFTKYGIFQAKIYNDGHNEHLVIMSRDFLDLQSPIVYVYSPTHECDPLDGDMCYCNDQMDIALKMVRQEGGVIIYYSGDVRNIDRLLEEIHACKLESKDDVMTKTKINPELKMDQRAYQTIGFIFQDLKFSSIKLITQDINIVQIAQKLGLEIIKKAPVISFDYGEERMEEKR